MYCFLWVKIKRMCPKSDGRDSNPPSSHIKLVQTEKGKRLSRWLHDWPWAMERNLGRACSGILSKHWSPGHRPLSIGNLGVGRAATKSEPRDCGQSSPSAARVRGVGGQGLGGAWIHSQSEGHHPSGSGKGSEDFERHLCISICQHLLASTMNSGTVAT